MVRIFLYPTFLVSPSAALSDILRSICFPPHWLHISCHHIPTSHCYQPAAIQSFCREQLAECDDRLFNGIRHNRSTSCTAFCRLPELYDLRPRRAGEGEKDGSSYPSPSVMGSAVSCPSGVRSEAPVATWRFVTFYRLTKPLLVSIWLTLNSKKPIPAKGKYATAFV